MGIFKNIFTWWEGATFGTWVGTRSGGEQVGEDSAGNTYFVARKADERGFKRRWVIYAGSNDASNIPPEWHCWVHHQIEGLPEDALPPARKWQVPPSVNLTGTEAAYRPAGAQGSGEARARSVGDYQAWSPDAA